MSLSSSPMLISSENPKTLICISSFRENILINIAFFSSLNIQKDPW